MSAGIWFWLIYVICLLFGGWFGYSTGGDRRYIGGGLVIFVLVGLVGWAVFGPPLK